MLRTALLAPLALLLAASAASAQEPTPLPAPPGGEAEPNQTLETATPIAAGERIRATRGADDVDHYSFTAEAGDRVFAAVTTSGSLQESNSRLALLGPDGTVLESDDDNGSHAPDSSSLAGTAIPATGTYYLRVDAPAARTQLLPYDVVLDVQSSDRLVPGTKALDERDEHAIELGAGDTVFVSLDLDPERDGSHFNGRLAFGAGNLIVANDSGTSDAMPSEAIVATVDRAGVYTVTVDSATGAQSGTYVLSITVIRAVERSCRTYSPAPGEIADLTATTFPIEVADAATLDHVALRLDLTHTFMNDLDVMLESPAGNRVAVFDDIGSTDSGQFTRMLGTFDDDAALPPLFSAVERVAVTPERYRLGWFAGQQAAGTWRLTFRDDARDDVGTLTKADLILCERPEVGSTSDLFAAGFESGDDGFEHSGTADEWERGTPAAPDGESAPLTACAEGAACFKTDLDGTYDPNSSQDLVSPPISLAGRTGRIHVSWAMWYQVERQPFEHFTVSVEEDGGANSRTLFSASGVDMRAVHGNPLIAFALSAGWGQHRADISAYAGRTIRLRFHLDSDDSVQRRGVAVDDVRVFEQLGAPVPVAAPAGSDEPSPAAQSAPVASEPAISDLRLASRCVRRSADGRVRVAMSMRLAQPGPVRVRIDRAVGSRGRSSCPRANPERNLRYRRVATFRRMTRVRAQAAAVRRLELDLRLRPGLYRLSVRVGGSPPVRRFMRVVG